MSDEIKLGDIVVFKTDNRAFEVIGKYIVPDDRLWRVEAITEDDPPTPDRNRKYRLVAVDCPNVMLDEIPEIYVESYSEKLERELEEQRKEALKMKRNEIKQGDKVRVSKDAPRIYTPDWVDAMFDLVLKVTEVEDGNAMVEFAKRTPYRTVLITTIPTKYLVKVDAEAKEAKFKVGDIIDTPKGKGTVHIAIDDYCVVRLDNGGWFVHMETNIPYAPYTEPTEQTEAEKKPNVGSIKIPVEVDLTDSYWDAYAAGLAKEVALKVANKYNDPKEAAEYAVLVAKAVVEGLKGK